MIETPTRFQNYQVPDAELGRWYDVGWTYVGPADEPGHSIIKWESPRPPVAPFKTDEESAYVASAVAALGEAG